MDPRQIFLILLISSQIYGNPTSRSNEGKRSVWSQEKAVLLHESSSTIGDSENSPVNNKREIGGDPATSNSDNLLSFASAFDIQKAPLPVLARRIGEAPSNVYSDNDEGQSPYKFSSYETSQEQQQHQVEDEQQPSVEATRRIDSYENIPITNGIHSSRIYATPSVSSHSRGYNVGQSSAAPPIVYGSPSPPSYSTPSPFISSHGHDASSGYGPPSPAPFYGPSPTPIYGPSPAPIYGPGPVEEDREIRFVVHKEGDEELVKQTLTEKSKWNNEHVSFLKGPQFQIEQKQKLYLPPKPKMVVYILLKEPKVNTHVHVEGDAADNFQKPEVFIMYEKANGIEQVHHDVSKDKASSHIPGPTSGYYNNNNNYDSNNSLYHKRDTDNTKTSASESSSVTAPAEDDAKTASSSSSSSSSSVSTDDLKRLRRNSQSTSSSKTDNIVVRKPKVVCTATME